MSNETASQQANATPPPPPELRLDDPSFQVSLQCIQDTVQHQFARPSLVREALVGERSPVLIGGEAIPQDNQKMAMLGDTILKSAYMDTVTRRNELLCDAISKRCDRIVSNENLEKCREWYLDTMITDVEGEYMPSNRTIAASMVEAIIGAVWMDSDKDLEVVKVAIRNLLDEDTC